MPPSLRWRGSSRCRAEALCVERLAEQPQRIAMCLNYEPPSVHPSEEADPGTPCLQPNVATDTHSHTTRK